MNCVDVLYNQGPVISSILETPKELWNWRLKTEFTVKHWISQYWLYFDCNSVFRRNWRIYNIPLGSPMPGTTHDQFTNTLPQNYTSLLKRLLQSQAGLTKDKSRHSLQRTEPRSFWMTSMCQVMNCFTISVCWKCKDLCKVIVYNPKPFTYSRLSHWTFTNCTEVTPSALEPAEEKLKKT